MIDFSIYITFDEIESYPYILRTYSLLQRTERKLLQVELECTKINKLNLKHFMYVCGFRFGN
jgi:hypothetical protein